MRAKCAFSYNRLWMTAVSAVIDAGASRLEISHASGARARRSTSTRPERRKPRRLGAFGSTATGIRTVLRTLQTLHFLGFAGSCHPLGAGGGGLKPVTLPPICPQSRARASSRGRPRSRYSSSCAAAGARLLWDDLVAGVGRADIAVADELGWCSRRGAAHPRSRSSRALTTSPTAAADSPSAQSEAVIGIGQMLVVA